MKKNLIILLIILTKLLYSSIEYNQINNLFNGDSEKYIRKTIQFYENNFENWNYFYARPQQIIRQNIIGRNIDTVRVLVLRVDFIEDSSSLTTGNGKFTYSSNGQPEYNTDGTHNLNYDPPHNLLYFEHQMEALTNYYLDDTKGHLLIEYDIFPFGDTASYTVPHNNLYYGNPSQIVYGLFYLLRDAVYVADRDTIANIDFSDYEAIIMFHSGSMWQTDYGNSPYDLPAVWIGGADGLFGEPIYANNRTDSIFEAVIYCETGFQDGATAFLQGGLAHEFGHQLGAYDLYDISGYSMGCNGWSLMGTGNWNLQGLVPPHHDIWNIQQISEYPGYLRPTYIDSDTTVELRWRGSKDTSAVYAIQVPITSREYYLITYRFTCTPNDTTHINPDSNDTRVWRDGVMVKFFDYDYSLPLDDSTGGLAIWHIDRVKVDSTIEDNAVNAGFPHGVDMEEADGIQDCELSRYEIVDFDAAFYGNKFDVWRPDGQNRFDFSSTPNTNDNFGNVTHIRIDSINIINDTIIKFNIKFDWKLENFPFHVGTTFDVNSPNICDLDLDGDLELITVTENGEVYAFENNGEGYLSIPGGGKTTVFSRTNADCYTSVAVGQADDDVSNGLEIVMGNDDGYIYAWHSLPAEFPPVSVEGFPVRTQAHIRSMPALIDLDGDGKLEVIFGSNDNQLYALKMEDIDNNGEADPVPGFPIDMGCWVWSTPVKGDTNLYAMGYDGVLKAFIPDANGIWTLFWSEFSPTLTSSTASLCVADINRDNKEEIVVLRGDSLLSLINEDGELLWNKKLNGFTFVSSPSLGDIDKDGYLDIVVASGVYVWAFNKNGAIMEGFPVNVGDTMDMQSSPVLSDVNGDESIDIIIGTIGGWICGYDNKGEILSGFPISVGDTLFSTPTICDINKDGFLDLIANSDDGYIHGWSLGIDTDNNPWAMIHYNSQFNAFVQNSSSTPIQFKNFSEIYIWPNPVENGDVYLRYILSKSVDNIKIDIFDFAGDRVFNSFGTTYEGINEVHLSVGSLAGGMYLMRVEIENTEEVKFIKMAVVK